MSVFGTRVAVARACQKSICFSNIDQLVVYLSIQISFIAPHKSDKMVSFLFAKQLL
ncbi:hypothetical protein N646_0374 [Vibrio alginolyticus NBRC 15630 = ATCC 17749]|uniref:Uncharacterized protein n=1 Tax=Vibrio alginolyticus (strain ATCC 17749 / DSM 2171 / NBRC 15630 / NCIMB 1903 / NCTC 12160 / XII-53) TaxID=1219076 RepID=A0A2I3BZK9_VIBAX|nr:hypothetical protein N646_0374 [Vibrio alginolyticus NBRC 15630 = ATCC 17749]GAK15164.1 hypothetical protein JCM19053_5052 [Vibrio sp. JCM 19053]